MSEYVLVHGGWHTGAELEPAAAFIRSQGHKVHTPTLRGNEPGSDKRTTLSEAIDSLGEYLVEHHLEDVVLVGHSYGGMVITGLADRMPKRIRRLVYWNAFVPLNGESLMDLVPEFMATTMRASASEREDGAIVLPFVVWREKFINDADLQTAQRTFEKLNSQPLRTLTDKIELSRAPAEFEIAKSYINCTEDTAMPPEMSWHPRMSLRLGLYRLVQVPGSHELCFSNPKRLAEAIMDAGRD